MIEPRKGKMLIDYILADMWSCATGLIAMNEEQIKNLENQTIVDFLRYVDNDIFYKIIKGNMIRNDLR
jgi:hypothetical protein